MARGSEINESLYVGCCLTGAPEDFAVEVEATKDILRRNYDLYEFVGLVAGTEEDVYRHDIKTCVANAGMVVGVCDYPSIGLGWELAESVNSRKPTLGVAHEKSTVTRLVLGAAAVEPNFTFERYQNMRVDVPKLIAARFAAERLNAPTFRAPNQ